MVGNEQNITLFDGEQKVVLTIYPETSDRETIRIISEPDALLNGEAVCQIIEGNYYEYELTKGYYLEKSDIVVPRKSGNSSFGRISPNIYTGTLTVPVFRDKDNHKVGEYFIEITSFKADYRTEYRSMLSEISEHTVNLLFQHSSLTSHYFETDFTADSKILYQKFAFAKSIIESEEINDAVNKILSAPVTRWKSNEVQKDIRSVKRIKSKQLKEFAGSSNRIELDQSHYLRQINIKSVPASISVSEKTDTVDNPENRFVKYALNYFMSFFNDFKMKVTNNKRLFTESEQLEIRLEHFLSHSIFKEITNPSTLPLNNPVLQRKEGYRELFRAWMMFDLAGKLAWHGGQDVYSGGKKDVAVLYEYWLFFKLLDVVKNVFDVNPESLEKLIDETKDGLCLKLKQGIHFPVKGIYSKGPRKLNVEFSYNRTFRGDNNYPLGGSWTRDMRPDYTLSLWPIELTDSEAEIQELITHIHFDAKYKVENLISEFSSDNNNLDEEKEEEKRGNYKRADILKMHTYRDAIRRTGGAYVLYPGDKKFIRKGFHEILPGLGAFAIKPGKSDATNELEAFIRDVVANLTNKASQREKMSYRTFEAHLNDESGNVTEPMPELYGENRGLIPDETGVLIGFYKNQEHLDWIYKHGLYNFRAGTDAGSLPLGIYAYTAKYLVLHGAGDKLTDKIFRIENEGPRIFTRDNLSNLDYPTPNSDLYLVYKIIRESSEEFANRKWDVSQLKDYKTGRQSAKPLAVSLTELLRLSEERIK